jgi:hypothetical protein
MLLKIFNSNRLGVLVIIILLPVVYWMPDFIRGFPVNNLENAGTLPGMLITYVNSHYRFLSLSIALLIILFNAYLLSQLNTIHIFIPARTHLPAFFYIILAVCFNPIHHLTASLVASTLVILVLYRVVATYKTEGISYNYLDAGFLMSLASLIYFPAIFFFMLILTGLILIRPFNWREWVYVFIGFMLPYLFLISGYYMAGVSVLEYFPGLPDLFVRNRHSFNLIQWTGWLYIFFMLLYGSYFMVATIDSMKIHGRKIFLLFLWLFLFSGIIYISIPGTGIEVISFTAIPMAFLFSHYFNKCKKNWINEILFSLFVLLLILLRIL